jgi:predicted dithiol-disulfide oxidoreductase (DUF899 family)
MVKIEKDYVFEGPQGQVTLAELFNGRRQLIIQHVMYGPDWDAPCPDCSASIDEQSQGVFDHLAKRDTAFAMVSGHLQLHPHRAIHRHRGPGLSCFLRDGDIIYHPDSVFARGTEYLGNAYTLLDQTALAMWYR